MNLKPATEHVLIERIEESDRYGSLYLPEHEDKREVAQKGRVLAVGRGKVTDAGALIEPRVSVGDMVIFEAHKGTEVSDTEVILCERFIMGVVE